ncbi:MAG: 5'-nucleotidase [Gammaproteobacteria bacterium RIFCSPHIGHO2_12_FULL_45_9]|nr:MAG: 5'-nucleotidase [Gammaproteobacteria bacterium RIFCSPHIGHO2_12_FULL_45_9]
MPTDLSEKLVIAISSRALFDLDESNAIFEQEGIESYAAYQIARENEPLLPGVAFPFVQKLLSLNTEGDWVEVILLSRNSTHTGLRVFNTIQHYNLPITRAVFTNGESPYHYIPAFNAHLFLSTHATDVTQALAAGCAAATLLPHTTSGATGTTELRIAFDGDSVLFSDESERIYQAQGLDAFAHHEITRAHEPLPGGPFKGFLTALHTLQNRFPANTCPIRTALVTARQAPAHKRVIHTLRAWNIRIDEAFFLGGLEKQAFLSAFRADIFFDDHPLHCERAKNHVPTGHVPNGIVNQ